MFRKVNFNWLILHGTLSACIIAVFFGAAILFQKTATETTVYQAKVHLADEVSTLTAHLQSVISTRTEIVRSMAHFIEIDPEMSNAKFSQIASLLTKDSPAFRNLAAAPDLVIRYIYPEKGNKAALGLDYRKIPAQLIAVELTRKTGETVLAGPIHLVQGGDAFIIRHPVNIHDPQTGKEHFWGIVSGVVDVEHIYAEIWPLTLGHQTKFAIRPVMKNGGTGGVFLGSADLFSSDAIVQEIKFPNGRWRIAAKPAVGWPQHAKDYLRTRTLFAVSCLFTLMLVNVSLSLLKKRMQMENILQNAIEAIPSGFALYDENDRLTVLNSKFREAYATSADIIRIGAKFEEILRAAVARGQFPEAKGREEAWIKERLEAHRAANTTVEHTTDDGRWIRAEERRTDTGGIVGIRTDITALKKATEAAEEANRMKSEFLSTMSHELRTPLTVILGYTPLLASLDVLPSFRAMQASLDSLRDTHPDCVSTVETVMKDVSRFATTMDRNGKHLLSLINNILDISKIEAGKMTLNKEILESDEIVQSVVEQLQPMAAKKNIYLTASLDGAEILAERTRLKQILINLIGNAIKFTETGGINVKTEKNENMLTFRVCDTGPGIPDQFQDRIFNQFTQVDSSDEREYGGTGLGLAISEKLVKLHGGTIDLTSAIGKGSVFRFTIPLVGSTSKRA